MYEKMKCQIFQWLRVNNNCIGTITRNVPNLLFCTRYSVEKDKLCQYDAHVHEHGTTV